MTKIKKAKETCARLKGHFTSARKSLERLVEARKSLQVIEDGFRLAKAKLKNWNHMLRMWNSWRAWVKTGSRER